MHVILKGKAMYVERFVLNLHLITEENAMEKSNNTFLHLKTVVMCLLFYATVPRKGAKSNYWLQNNTTEFKICISFF
jgi:hypothetical protein